MATARLKDKLKQTARTTTQAARAAADKSAQKAGAKKQQEKPAKSTPVRNVKSRAKGMTQKAQTAAKEQNRTPRRKPSVQAAGKQAAQKVKGSQKVKDYQKMNQAGLQSLSRSRFAQDMAARQAVRQDNIGRGTNLPQRSTGILKDLGMEKYREPGRKENNPNTPAGMYKTTLPESDLDRITKDADLRQKNYGLDGEKVPTRDIIDSANLDPLSALKADSMSHANFGRGKGAKIAQKEKTDKELVQEAVDRLTAHTRKRGARQQTLSRHDNKLRAQMRDEIKLAKQDYDTAKRKGDTEGMAKAHQRAETIRRQEGGYSGGATGAGYETPEISREDRATLNKEGLTRLAAAKLGYDNAKTDEERERYRKQGADIRKSARYQREEYDRGAYRETDANGRMRYAGTAEERQKEQEQAAAIPQAILTGLGGSFASLPEGTLRALQADAARNQERLQTLSDIRGGGEVNVSEPGAIDPDSLGQRLLRQSQEYREKATEGQKGLERYLTEALITGGEMAPGLLATALTGGAAAPGLAVMGAQAAGQRMGDLNAQGVDPVQAFNRGILSGAIEAGSELIPLRNLAKIARGGGDTFARNLVTQALEEVGTEEASEIGNYLADRAFGDPNASLTARDLMDTAAISALTSIGMGAGAGMIGARRTGQRSEQDAKTITAMDQVTPTVDALAEAENAIQQRVQALHAREQEALAMLTRNSDNPQFFKHFQDRLNQIRQEHGQLQADMIGLEMQKQQRTRVEQEKAQQAQRQAEEAQRAEQERLEAAQRAQEETQRAQSPVQAPQEAAQQPQTNPVREQATEPVQTKTPTEGQETARATSQQYDQPENHIDNRTSETLGDRRAKAFQWDHPEVKPFYQDAARALRQDVEASMASVRNVRASQYNQSLGKQAGTIMDRNEPLRQLHEMGLSSTEILKGLDAIIRDDGAENIASAKRVELALDDMLSNGYIPVEAGGNPDAFVGPNRDYIQAKSRIAGGTEQGSFEEYLRDNALSLELGEVTEDELRAEWEAQQEGQKNTPPEAEEAAQPERPHHPKGTESSFQSEEEELADLTRRAMAFMEESEQGQYDQEYVDQQAQRFLDEEREIKERWSVGAAPGGFDPFSRLANEYGTIEPGENPARMVDVPVSTNGEDRVSKAARTFLEAQITSDPTQRRIERDIVNGLWSHSIKGLDETMDRAYSFLDSRGLEAGIQRWQDVVDGKVKASEDDIALGIALFANAERTGHSDYAAELAAQIAAEGTTAGRMANAIRLLKRTTPEGKVYYVKKMYDKIQNDLTKKYGKKAPKLETNEELLNRYRDAETEVEQEKALDDIYLDIAKQMPRRLGDIVNAWRYLAMLGNPRTHIRNVIGNILFGGLEYASGKASAVVQRAILPQEQRTRAIRASVEAKEFARLDAEEMETVLKGDKYDNDLQGVQRKVQEIALGPFSFLSKGNSRLLSWEDFKAKQRVYRRSLAEYITAKGWDPNNLTTAQLEQARGHAIHDAQVATFQEENAAAKAVSKLEQTNKAFKVLVGGVMPFKSVPFNIAKQGLVYSPIGAIKSGRDLARALSDMKNDVQTGNKTAAEAIDGLTKGLTGSSVLAVGALLAAKGLLTAGGSDDDDLESLDTAQGSQEYALKIGDRSYTLDWAAPTALPLFMGAEAYNIYHDMTTQAQGDEGEEGEELDTADKTVKLLNAVISSGTRFFEPMMNMTVLSGVSGAIKSAAYADDPLTGVGLNMIQNYAGQFVPTLLGQVNRTFFDDTRRTTFVDKNSPLDATWQRFLQRQENKIPGVSQKNMPYLDVWGRESRQENPLLRALENFVSPGYLKKVEDSQVGDELKRLNDAGFEDVLPKKPTSYSKINGEYMTQDQYMDRAKAQGKTALDLLMEAVKDKGYKDMSDQEKAEYVKSIFDYAKEKGKQAAGADVTKKVAALDQAAQDYSIGVGALLRASMLVQATGDTDGNGSIKTEEAWNAIQGMDVSENEKRALFDLHNGTKQSYDEYAETAKKAQEKAKKEAEAAEKAAALLGSSATVDVNTFQSEVDAIGGFNQMSYTNFFDTMDKLGVPEKERANYYEIVQSYKGHPWKKTYAEAKKYKGR